MLTRSRPEAVSPLGLTPEVVLAVEPAERQGLVEAFLRRAIAAAARIPASRIDPDAPLTALGLDSLAAVEIEHRVESELGAALPAADLLAGASLRSLAADVLEDLADTRTRAQRIVAGAAAGDFPLSHGQRALWFLARLAPSSTAYHLAGAARIHGGLDAAALGRAVDALAARHGALRTTFYEAAGGEPRQRLGDFGAGFAVEDAAGWSEDRLRRRLDEEGKRPFDLEAGPLLRVLVLEASRREHRLLLVVHHLVADLWSLDVLLSELGLLYAREAGGGAPLPPPPPAYADWARHHERLLAGPQGEKLERYWLERLAGVPRELELATDRPRPRLETFDGFRETRRLAAPLTEELGRLARANGATLFMALLSAFQALLHRVSGQERFAVGSPAAGRQPAGAEGVVGYLVNPMVLAADLAGRPTGGELLVRVRETALGAFRHQGYPFPRLAERLQPERDPARPPLFQVMFALHKAHRPGGEPLAAFALGFEGAELALGGLTLESLALDCLGAPFELSLLAAEWQGGIALALEAKSDLWERTTARRFLGHYERLARALAVHPDREVASLPMLSAAEGHQLTAEWDRPAPSYAADRTLAELFAAQVRRSPDTAAVAATGGVWTYGELDRRTERLAAGLRAEGVGPEVVVGIGLERGPELVAALFAVWKAGGVYLALDPALPAERLAFMVEDAAAPVVITRETFERFLAAAPEPEAAGGGPTGANLAYVIYTSGSTGRPKGVAITHANLAPTLYWGREALGLGRHTRALHTLSPTFDFGVFEILTTLVFGGTYHMTDPEDLADPRRYARRAAERRVNTVHATPSFIASVVAAGGELSGLDVLHLGGEALTAEYLDRLFPALDPACEVFNGYGPTEATVNTTLFPAGDARRRRDGRRPATPIGRPSAAHRVYVVDAAGRKVPAGIPGELRIGGGGLARGYLNRPALSAERFLSDCFGSRPGGRLYRTGDRVRWLAGGDIDFLGRFDGQVKVRGFRVELGEIEAALAGLPGVGAAAAVDTTDQRLVAYVVPRAGAGLRPEVLRRRLEQRLPAYMVPAAIVELAALPATPSGKVDRRALRREAPAAAVREGGGTAPRTALEELLARIWADVLGRGRVAVDEDFFALGGHSLLATRVAARIRDALGVDLPLSRLFEARTIAALARSLGELEGRTAAPPVGPAPRDEPPVASFAQERLWFLAALEPGAAYNVPGAVRLRGELRPDALAAALAEVARRHETLRTRFADEGGRPRPVVAPRPGTDLARIDLGGIGTARAAVQLPRLLAAEGRRPFDLGSAPLLRALLVRLSPRDHVLLLVVHHIVADGWSLGILVDELAALYRAALGTADGAVRSPLRELTVQYSDYAFWQRRWLHGPELDRQIDYWRRRLAGTPELELPIDRPRPARRRQRGASLPLNLPAELSAALEALSRRRSVTPFMTLSAAFAALLGRWSGQREIALGAPVAHRRQRELEGLIGFFVNTLVLAYDLSAERDHRGPGFDELLGRTRELVLAADAHQDVPFEKLVEELAPERDLAKTPLFQVMLAYMNTPLERLRLPGLEIEPVDVATGSSKFDLTLSLGPTPQGFAGSLEYDLDLFEATTAGRLRRHFATLLASAVADPGRRLAELEVMPASERAQLLEGWNDTGAAYPEAALHRPFEDRAARAPEAVAAVCGEAAVSYGELDREADRLARRLIALGVRPDHRVGVHMERSPELVIALLGVLKAGAAYVPLDPSFPAERLTYMVDDLSRGQTTSVVLVRAPGGEGPLVDGRHGLDGRHGHAMDRVHQVHSGPCRPSPEQGALGFRCVAVQPSNEPEHPEPAESRGARTQVDLDQAAYLLYTSGSTGRPKGVVVSHRGAGNQMRWLQETFRLSPSDRFVQKTPITFDASVLEVFWPLGVGARLVLARPGGHRDPDYLARLITRREVTAFQAVPSLLEAFLDLPGLESGLRLRHLFSGGEPLTPGVIRRFTARLAPLGTRLHNLYGPTEAAVDSTSWSLDSPASELDRAPIGRPVANTAAYVLDRALRPAPAGAAAELQLGGVQLARGYLGRPAPTAERFVPDPLRGVPGGRLYRTGDLARWLPSGDLDCLGRIDFQVKVRGHRVELGEIEAALAGERDLAAAAVVDVAGAAAGADRRLVAFVVPRRPDAAPPSAAELRRRLEERLPAYMVPSAIVGIAALPTTSSGKVDRQALRRSAPAPAEGRGLYTPPRTATESLVAEVWAGVLGLERVGADDDFFDLGGHSLVATRVISRLREALGVEIELRSLFEKPTVARFAAALEDRRPAGAEVPPIVARQRGAAALSFAQERLWFLHRLHPESTAYHLAAALRLRGALDVRALRAALTEIVRRHEVLRTHFEDAGSGPVQVVEPPSAVPVPTIDLTGLERSRRLGGAHRAAATVAGRPFDLGRGPLLRAALARLGRDEHTLAVVVHHVAFDGWSTSVFLGELGALYGAFAAGRPSPLAEPAVQYADYADWQRRWLGGGVLDQQLDYWRRRLAGAGETELTTDRPRRAGASLRGATVPVVLPSVTARSWSELGRRRGATPFMTALAGFAALLGRLGGRRDVAVATPAANRRRGETEGLIGFFVNTLVLYIELEGKFSELLGRVREATLEAEARQDLPFERVVRELRPERAGTSAFLQVLFALAGEPLAVELEGLETEVEDIPGTEAKAEISLTLGTGGAGIAGTFEYAAELFDAATVRRFARSFEVLAAGIAADPDAALDALPLLAPSERHQVLAEWNDTESTTCKDATLAALFPAGHRADAVAVEGGGETLTYGHLASLSGALAEELRRLGVGPEVRVGLAAERSPAMVVAILAVLDAGGAYVPLDRGHPRERLAFMIEDARVSLLVSDRDPGELAPKLPFVRLDAAGGACGSAGGACPVGGGSAGGTARVADPSNLAYVMYTSGSTGHPKGIEVSHRAIAERILWAQAAYPLAAGDRLLMTASYGFDISLWEILAPLAVGGRLVLPPAGSADVARLASAVAEREITAIHFVPSLMQAWLDEPAAERPRSLRRVFCGGEALPAALRERFLERQDAELHHFYGPTEAAISVTAWNARQAASRVSIGRPITGARIVLADRTFRPVPLGVPGELTIAGGCLARGYQGRADATAERFAPDAASGAFGGRVYRTGDLARYLGDGRLEFLGRIDHQVKVRGFRIEPGEIEAALAGCPGVGEAVVLAREGRPSEVRLVAYWTPAAGAAARPRPEELKRRLTERLPPYMVPAAFVERASFPLNANGKIDRRALAREPLPVEAGDADGTGPSPRTPAEELLAGIWSELLGLDRVGIHQDFFDLGGHSLLATRVAARVREAFAVELPLRRFFDRPTIAALAREIEHGRAAAAAAAPIEPVARTGGPLAPSFAQERMWFVEQLRPGGAAYNLQAAVRLRGVLRAGRLGAALTEIARRHEALRTRFENAGGKPVQVVWPAREVALARIDLSGLADALPRALGEAAIEARRPFDLEVGPLLRAVLFELSPGRESVLLLALHHIVSDGWSVEVLARELGSLYAGEALPELPVQYADYAAWQRRFLEGGAAESQIAYWRRRLADLEALELPADRPRHRAPERLPAAVVELALPDLRPFAARSGSTPFMAFLAGFSALCSRLTGRRDVALGSPVSGRTRAEVEGLIGLFVNTLVLRLDLSGEPDFTTLLARAREVTLGAWEHQDVPFEKVVEALRPRRAPDEAPFFRMMLAVQNAPAADLVLPGLAAETLPLAAAEAKFDLIAVVADAAPEQGVAEMRGGIEYRRDLFDPTTARRFARGLEVLLRAAVDEPAGRIAELPVVTAAERWQALGEWNDTRRPFPSESSLAELFAARAAQSAEAAAIVDETSSGEAALVTYRELSRRARRLAGHLAELGVEPDSAVGVAVERSAAFVEATVAVVLAGGAYVPLDPAYPAERRAFMIDDAGVRVVVGRGAAPHDLPAGVRWVDSAAAAGPPPAARSGPDSRAYVIYTSGSTGRPKGISVSHRAVCRLVLGTDYVELTPGDRVAHASNTAFDAATFELWGALLNGASLVVIPPSTALDPRAFARRLTEERVSALFVTTALFNEISRQAPGAFGGLAHLLFGGEAVDPRWVRRVVETAPPRRLLHVYGPTECTTFSTWHPVGAVPAGATTLPVGGPLANAAAHVVDGQFAVLGAGVPGELVIGGDGLAHGYAARPAATAAAFVPDPWTGTPAGGRLYRTGDLVRRRGDGAVEFLGRLDHQVKLRGFRIELGEIEAALVAHPGVADAAVLVREAGAYDRRLAAFWTPAAGARIGTDELRRALAERLPPFMVPAAFVALESLPINPNGKVDRAALERTPLPEVAAGEAESAAPRTPVEERLAAIWAEVLGSGRVGIHDDFFDLGGHSLLVTQVAARVRDDLAVELPLRRFFERSTIAALAEEVEAAGGARAAAPPLVAAPRTGDVFPLSFAQERLWFLDRLRPGSTAYNVSAAVELEGRLAAAALGAAWQAIVHRHEALRTVFEETEDGAVQRLTAPSAVDLATVGLESLDEADGRRAVRALAAGEARHRFDLAAGPLHRALLLRLGESRHVLLLTLHHIVSDGWSVGVLMRELGTLYGAFAAGLPSPLPALEVQYPDYALWQRRHLRGETLERQIAYWRERLAGVPVLELPADHPRRSLAARPAATLPVKLPAALSRELAALGRGRGATLYMALLAGFAALMSRWSAQTDLAVGSPVANRRHQATEGLIGFFVNTLALRVDLAGDPAFQDLLAKVRETALEAQTHQDVPFEKVVAEIRPERHLDASPLFQVTMALQNVPLGRLELPGLTLEALEPESGEAKFDLALGLRETAAGLAGSLEYDRGLFDPTTVRRMTVHFANLLREAADDPARTVGELGILAAAERAAVLEEWQPRGGFPSDLTLPGLFRAQVERAGDAVAVVCEDEVVSYLELDRRADGLAAELSALGVGPEVAVGVCLERGPRVAEALFAVWKAGGVYLALDTKLPRRRRSFLLEDAEARVLVDREGSRLVHGGPTARSHGHLDPANPAYAIYTSGSTGKPKGVLVPHAALGAMMLWTRDYFGFSSRSKVLQTLSHTFDYGVFEILTTLLFGGVLHWMAREEQADPELCAAYAERHGVNTLHATPSFIRAVVGSGAGLSGLELLQLGGEALTAELVDEVFAATGPGCTLHNGYGPTEATINTTVFKVGNARRRRDLGRPSVPIGRASANHRVHVLDAAGAPVPAGVAGELQVGGECLARGYLRRPARTAASFVPDPFGPRPGGRLYRTGDRVRFLADGELEFFGRFDHQVKIRGFRVELGEIEALLAAEDGVTAAVVVDVPGAGGPGDRRLVAFLEAGRPAGWSRDELVRRLEDALPPYMVPAAWVEVEAWPTTTSGKVDRAALRRRVPELGTDDAGRGPRTPTEEVLAGIWSEVLDVERPGVAESFFDLGGHSLLATQVMSRLRRTFGVELELRRLFEGPTIEKLARHVDAARRAGAPEAPPVAPAPRGGALPLSFAQERLWFLDQLEPGSPFYNIPMAVRIRGPLRLERLERCLAEIAGRHEVLRTTYPSREGRPFQEVSPAPRQALPLVDLAALGEEERRREARRRLEAEIRGSFDLERGPLWRPMAFRLGDGDTVFSATVHHIASDGWSSGVLLGEILAFYGALSRGETPAVPELPVQYADYAVWQRAWLSGASLERQMAYWRGRLAGLTNLELPTDRPRPAVETFRGAQRPIGLDRALTRDLEAVARHHGATLFMTLLAGMTAMLSRMSGQTDVAVGSPIANRQRYETEHLIGFFANTLVLTADLGGSPTWAELLAGVREATLDAYAHQDVPFEKLVEELRPERDMSRNPLFQVMLVLQNQPPARQALDEDVVLEPVEVDMGIAKFDFTIFWREAGDRLDGMLEYNTDLFDATTALRMTACYEALLRSMAADPEARPGRVDVLARAGRHQLLYEWNATREPELGQGCLHVWVEEQVARTPDALAVVDGDRRFDYRELNERANQLAHTLIGLGVGPEALVGICVERSIEMVLGFLAVLKAGGAGVALDPAYPRERLSTIIRDAGLRVLLADSHLLESLPEHGGTNLLLDQGWGPFEGAPATNPGLPVHPDNPIYAIYTSGSTGQPKGILVTHRAFGNLMEWQIRRSSMAPRARTVQFATFGFCVSFQEMFSSWCAGGTLVMAGEMMRRDIGSLVAFLEEWEIERLHVPFAALKQLAEVSAASDRLPSRLKEVVSAGEQLQVSPSVRRLFERLGGCVLRNQYGASETHVVADHCLAGSPEAWPAIPPVGRPVANVRIYLLDRHMESAPIGVPGALFTSGLCDARGYLNDPVLTAEKFIPDPFGAEPGRRLYRTGDLARRLAGGEIEYMGRIDTQVKVRGYRVELGEIETVLARQAGVRDLAVVPQPGPGGAPRLVAYVVLEEAAAEAADEALDGLRSALKEKLPEYMVPAVFLAMDVLPLNANGKLDREALPVPDAAAGRRDEYVAPRDEVEEALAAIIAEVLEAERVGVTSSFFELGGHSLLATRLMSKVRGTFRVDLPLRSLFEGPTVEELARAVVARESAPGQSLKIARVYLKIRSMSSSQVRDELRARRSAA